MPGLTRKNLSIDPESPRALACRRRTSKSPAARDAADLALAAEEVAAAIRDLHEPGGLAGVFVRLPDQVDVPDTRA